mmetsp:Transcript_35702/g.31497  ORF Transcript_35702/g.31497 Transcript_35702/m.31497 type:complete len:175 (-) Transcript_35702:16-540(-)
MSNLRRRERRRQYAESSESGEEMLKKRLYTLHGNNAIIWARWQQQIKFLGWIVFFYAGYHSYNDLIYHYQNNKHLEFIPNILDCLWQIAVHIITAINALFVRQYINLYPSPKSKMWLFYIWPISIIECLFIMHSFPMGTFYLLLCLAMVYFVDSQQEVFKATKGDIHKLASKHQ